MNLYKKALREASRVLSAWGPGIDPVEDLVSKAEFTRHEAEEYVKTGERRDLETAQKIITAYLEAMVVTTREELSALPVGSVVIETLPAEVNDVPWVFEMDELGTWMTPGADTIYFTSQINLPARVIYTPEETE